jgi:uncharacterized protein (DUF2147 family)
MRQSALLMGFSLFFWTAAVFADDTEIIGRWKTIDDETGEPKSIVEIYAQNGKRFGKITQLFIKPGNNPNPVCDECADDNPRKDQPIQGMVIIKDLVKEGSEFVDGTILDPQNGEVYRCKLWIEEGQLKVRGYIAFFYRTQTWLKVD